MSDDDKAPTLSDWVREHILVLGLVGFALSSMGFFVWTQWGTVKDPADVIEHNFSENVKTNYPGLVDIVLRGTPPSAQEMSWMASSQIHALPIHDKTTLLARLSLKMKRSVTIPNSVKDEFFDVAVSLLYSPSMDDKERQYWINMLEMGIMTPAQIDELRDILRSEVD